MKYHFISSEMLTRRFNLKSKTEILALATPVKALSGVYFLVQNNEIAYVGQSTNIYARIHAHAASKQFDSFAAIFCEPEERAAIETAYIMLFEPPLNGRIPQTKQVSTPIKVGDFINGYFYTEYQQHARDALSRLNEGTAI